jgi:hypothetical protein
MRKNLHPNSEFVLSALTYTRVDKIGQRINTSIDGMVSQFSQGLPKSRYSISDFETPNFMQIIFSYRMLG